MIANAVDALEHGDNYSYPQVVEAFFPRSALSLNQYVTFVSCGHSHSLAITLVGILKAWGGNEHGQLGLGDTCASPCYGAYVHLQLSTVMDKANHEASIHQALLLHLLLFLSDVGKIDLSQLMYLSVRVQGRGLRARCLSQQDTTIHVHCSSTVAEQPCTLLDTTHTDSLGWGTPNQ